MRAQPASLTSRPIRALIVTLGLWVTVRATLLWSETGPTTPPTSVSRSAPAIPASAAQASSSLLEASFRPAPSMVLASAIGPHRLQQARVLIAILSHRDRPQVAAIARTLEAASPYFPTDHPQENRPLTPATQSPAPLALARLLPKSRDRLSISIWTLVRPQLATDALAPGAELGGSQSGIRIFAPLNHRVAVTGQANTPLGRSSGSEASIGFAWRIPHLTLLAERRVAITTGGRNDFAFTAAGGADGIRLPAGAKLDTYVQAGVVGRDGFLDGAVRVERSIADLPGLSLAAGAGLWGGIQPGVGRIDIGPQLVARLHLGAQAMRIGAEWRQRVAGAASPSSGPALSLGADF